MDEDRPDVIVSHMQLYEQLLAMKVRMPQGVGFANLSVPGGNSYGFALNGQDNLVRDCRVEEMRHNYDFGTMSASGNVILDCFSKDGLHASDCHMFLSLANLLDNVTCDGDFLEARAYRPWGGFPVHGVTTTQSVF